MRWNDGTTTTVKLAEGDTYSKYSAFCAAYTKRAFGNNSRINQMIEMYDGEKLDELIEKISQSLRQRNREICERNHRKKIKRIAKALRLLEEAEKYNEQLDKR